MRGTVYRIEYYNRVYQENHSIEKVNRDDAIATAKSIAGLIEMDNVRLFEVTEIDYQ